MESTFNSVSDWPMMCKRILDKISQEMIPLLQERRAAPFLAEKFKRDVIKKMISKGRFDHLKTIGMDISVVFAEYGLDEAMPPSIGNSMPKIGDLKCSKNLKAKPRATRIISNAERRFRDIRPSEQQQEYERQLRHKFVQLDGNFDEIKIELEDDSIPNIKEELFADEEITHVTKKKKLHTVKDELEGSDLVEIMSDSEEEDSDEEDNVLSLLEQDTDSDEKPYFTPLSSDDEEEEDASGIDHDLIRNCQNLVLCQYDKIRRHKGRFKMYLTNGTMLLKGHDFVFRKANGEASMYDDS